MFGIFGNPYKSAEHQYKKYLGQAQATQQPYQNAGVGAIGNYQNWLQGQQNPSEFINNLMGQYQQSPYAQYMQNQSMNAGQNAASASGLMGSTPLMNQLQQNSSNIAGQDQNQWLQNVLGINTNYGQGQQNLMQGGQGAANALSNNYQNAGQNMGQLGYNQGRQNQQDWGNLIGNVAGMFL